MADDFTTFVLDTKWNSFPWIWRVILILRGRRKLYCDHSLIESSWSRHKHGKAGYCRMVYFKRSACPNCGYKTSKQIVATDGWHRKGYGC